jgi:hypothetical protein
MLSKKLFKKQNLKKILLVSLQKSGTHLINKVMEEAGFLGRGVGKGCTISDFRELEDNEYLWSHFAPSDEVQMALEEGNQSVYIIFNFRDPRDVLVSWFHWLHPKNRNIMHSHQSYMQKVYSHFTDDELVEIFIKNDKFREVEYNPIEQFRWSRVLYFHPGVLKIRFEDLVGSGGGGSDEKQLETIKDIFDYLGVDGVNFQKITHKIFDEGSRTFRKGMIGVYKEAVSKEQLKLFNKLHGDVIEQYGYELDAE